MKIIPLSAVPSQTMTVILNGQNCNISVYTLGEDNILYLDLLVQNKPIIQCVICHDRVRLIREPYLGFVGDLAFFDTQGTSDPVYSGLGSRYLLGYLT